MLGVDYVTTVLDGTTKGSILQYLIVLYGVSWASDYATSRALGDVMLGLLDEDDSAPLRVSYVPPDDSWHRPCWIQPHGGARMVVVRELEDGRVHFNIFRPLNVFRALAAASKVQSAARRRLPSPLRPERHPLTPPLLCLDPSVTLTPR